MADSHRPKLGWGFFPSPAASAAMPESVAGDSYGFHMLERRAIVLVDGSLRTYFALPPDYENLSIVPPRPRPSDRDSHWHSFPIPTDDGFRRPGNANYFGKRKFDEVDEDEDGINRDAKAIVEIRTSSKSMRLPDGAPNHADIDRQAVNRAFLRFIKLVYETPGYKKKCLGDGKKGTLQCLACSSAGFVDAHSVVMHAYNKPENDDEESVANHLGFHKSLCILMGWNYSIPPEHSKAYQNSGARDAGAVLSDLILWPPTVLVHSRTKREWGSQRTEGVGNKMMDSALRDMGFRGCKTTAMYGREGHSGIHAARFSGDFDGLKEAVRLVDHFKRHKGGGGGEYSSTFLLLGADLATVSDLDKLTVHFKKKVSVASFAECMNE
ncbi:hypothetical protein M569_12506 [Genlisea aurea]|uniref:XS domain-containing protein n=1 Tax=Genlisea aurea TaxID=192259 RepID=S8DR39_9LAMI|nr:hypothetical protein M569_12506 [Genlisea aurea]